MAQDVVLAARVVHEQLMATTPAVQQTGQQRGRALGGARVVSSAHVLGDRGLHALELFPADVAFVGAGDERQPPLAWLAVNRPARLAAVVVRELLGLTVGVRAAVRGLVSML